MATHPLSPESAQVEVPKFYEFIPNILAYLADGIVHANREIYSSVAELAKLSEEQQRVILRTVSVPFIWTVLDGV